MNEMNMELRVGEGKCLYEQIYEHIRKEIREGKLLAGEKLPSTRSLAEYLQISRSTVDYAYEQLLSEGYIESRPYRGYFVCRVEEILTLTESPNLEQRRGEVSEDSASFADWTPTEVGQMENRSGYGQGNGPESRQEKVNSCVCDFSPNAIDMSAFPFSVWNRISRGVLAEGERGIFTAGPSQGEWELRWNISRYLHSSRGVNCTPEQIIIGAGNDYLLMLLEKILGRHVKIAIENPTYKRAWHIFRSFAYEITTVDMDDAGMKPQELRTKEATVAYVMPSHQFPTGTVMPIGRRMELLKWAEEEADRYLIEDDYDSEFRYRGKPIPSLQGADRIGKVIYIGTFSKAIAPAIRISYMVLPKPLLEVYHAKCYFYSSTVSRIDQLILNEFIKEGHFERHLNKMRKVYKGKHDQMLNLLRPFKEHFTISGENAGLHLLLTCKDNRSEEELVEVAKAAGVKVYPLSESRVSEQDGSDRSPNATFLLGYGGLTEAEMTLGIEKLREVWL